MLLSSASSHPPPACALSRFLKRMITSHAFPKNLAPLDPFCLNPTWWTNSSRLYVHLSPDPLKLEAMHLHLFLMLYALLHSSHLAFSLGSSSPSFLAFHLFSVYSFLVLINSLIFSHHLHLSFSLEFLLFLQSSQPVLVIGVGLLGTFFSFPLHHHHHLHNHPSL